MWDISAGSARFQAVCINTRGDSDDPNALCSAVTGSTCFCKTGYTGTDQGKDTVCADVICSLSLGTAGYDDHNDDDFGD